MNTLQHAYPIYTMSPRAASHVLLIIMFIKNRGGEVDARNYGVARYGMEAQRTGRA